VGLIVDIMEEVARRKSVRLEWVRRQTSGDSALTTGAVDLWPGIARTPERAGRFYVTRPWIRSDFCLVSTVEKPLVNASRCAGHKVAFVDGPVTRILAARHLPGIIAMPSGSRLDAVLALCRGDAEAAFTEIHIVHSLLLRRPKECSGIGFQMDPMPGVVLEMGIGAPFRNAALADAWRDEIDALQADGTFARALAHWSPFSAAETEALFAYQEARFRNRVTGWSAGFGLAVILFLFWQNLRVTRARSAAEAARANSEQSLAQVREAQRRLQFHIDRMPLAYIVFDRNGYVREWNPAAERIFGWTAEEACGQHATLLVSRDSREETAVRIRNLLASESENGLEAENASKSGKAIVTEWFTAPLRDGSGSITGTLAMGRDISAEKRAETERTRLEEELRQSQKLESIGRLAGGIAHDFNNLLTVINGYSSMMLSESSLREAERGVLTEILGAGERATGLTRQLLAFSRKQVVQPAPLDLNGLIEEVREMLQRLLGEDVELATVPGALLVQVMGDRSQMQQVLMNLAVNARDAMPEGGRLTIETANVDLDAQNSPSPEELAHGPYASVTVSDTGIGMDEEIQKRIFEPFFTTKEVGKGTGLGLSTVYGIVRQCKGWVGVESKPGAGTKFRILLPGIEAQAPKAPVKTIQPEGTDAPVRGLATVLVVEDEPKIRQLLTGILRSQGYLTLEAAEGEEALRIAGEHRGPIHAMITDLVMPGMSGRQLAARMRSERAGIRVLFVSGYPEAAITGDGMLEPGASYMAKPFSLRALADKIAEVLAG
jgi:PAS domain S-box-containing protein